MPACKHCGGPVPPKRPGQSGAPRRYCTPACYEDMVRSQRKARTVHATSRVSKPKPERVKPVKGMADLNPATTERGFTDEEFEFVKAMDRFKREAKRPFPTFTDCLRVAISLGYRKVADPAPIPAPEADAGEPRAEEEG